MADYDVLIVGGGPVGAALALALRGSGLAVGLAGGAGPTRPPRIRARSRFLMAAG